MMLPVRSTVRIDDDLMQQLKERAAREGLSLSRMLNRALREGLRARRPARSGQRPYREHVYAMGEANFPVDKALATAAALEDAEVLRKLAGAK
jgi:metal-responsive CopG/Arc/MetJ family transcriptional regulator